MSQTTKISLQGCIKNVLNKTYKLPYYIKPFKDTFSKFLMGDSALKVRNIIYSGKILNKEEYYLLYNLGYFGNKLRTWNSYLEIIDSSWNGKVSMRSKRGIDRELVEYGLPLKDVPRKIDKWVKLGHPVDKISFNESAPDNCIIFQGEVSNIVGGLYLSYSTMKLPMNKDII